MNTEKQEQDDIKGIRERNPEWVHAEDKGAKERFFNGSTIFDVSPGAQKLNVFSAKHKLMGKIKSGSNPGWPYPYMPGIRGRLIYLAQHNGT
jgi:hypothetical protein